MANNSSRSVKSSTRPIVLLTNPIHPTAHALLETATEVRVAPATDPETLRQYARDAAVIIVRAPLPESLLSESPKLLGVVRHGAGLDMIPVAAATRHGIAVANVPKANAISVAEYVVGQMITLMHRLNRIDHTLRNQSWSSARKLADESTEAAEKVIGIIGVGAIGTELARICSQGLRMRVVGVRHSSAPMPPYITAVTLDEIFPLADVIVLACPLNDSTRGLVNAARIAQMKPQAFLINVSRGPVIDESALIEALSEQRLAGAALDVFEQQPLPDNSPLRTLPNVILSAHLAGITDESMQRMGRVAAEQTLALVAGQLPQHLVNAEAKADILTRLSHIGRT